MKRIFTLLAFLAFTSTSLYAQLIINEVLYDPSNTGLDGDANGDGTYSQGDDEFIEFYNAGNNNLDIGGYEVWDDTSKSSAVYIFPTPTIIPPHGALVLFGGGTPVGSFGGAVVLVGNGLSLNNSGEIIRVKDANGNIVLSFDSDALSNNPDESYTRNPDITGDFEQHTDNTLLMFSPGTKVDGSSFDTTAAVDVVFSVDMTNYTGSFNTVYVSGDFNSWCANCDALKDDNNNGLWELTLPLTKDSIEYRFNLDSLVVDEVFNGTESCVKTTGSVSNRFSLINGNTTLPTSCFNACEACASNMSLKGVMDLITPLGGVSGKAVHVVANADIADLSLYGIGVANNGGGTDGEEYTFPNLSAKAGDNILVVRDSAGLAAYFDACWTEFDQVFVDTNAKISQNGDDAIELFRANTVVETYGDPDVDGTDEVWEYTGSWAYQGTTGWEYGALKCTDSSNTIYDSGCKYPICPSIYISSITVTGEGNATTITDDGGDLQMMATISPKNAEDSTVTWSVDKPSIATIDANGLLEALANGVVVVTATANDDGKVSGSLEITISGQTTIGMPNIYQDVVKIAPNPTNNMITISSDLPVSNARVISITGQVVQLENHANGQYDLSSLEAGMYFLEVEINNSWSRHKIIKK